MKNNWDEVFDGLMEDLLPDPPKAKPIPPKPKLVSDSPVELDVVEARKINQEREDKLLVEERRQAEEAHQRSVEFCKCRGIKPPPDESSARELRQQRLDADRALRLQLTVDYHMEMKHFHEAAEREFRDNDILGLWR